MLDLVSNLSSLKESEQVELLTLLKIEDDYQETNKLYFFSPYKKQKKFIDLGGEFSERCFMAANQVGKTICGGAEVAFHLTGRYPGTKGYPDDGLYGSSWDGKVFENPVVFWVGGETNETIRKTTQRILCGRIEEMGAPGYGYIPKSDIARWGKSPFGQGLIDHVVVNHYDKNGLIDGVSIVYFKAYSQGREKWQGDTIDGVWFDEEPSVDIYSEGLTRTNAKGQFGLMTYTPLLGMSEVTTGFLKSPSSSQVVVSMTIDEAEHYTKDEVKQITESYPEYQREARAKGIPAMGSGRVFQITEESISCPSFQCPDHYFVINGMDFGWDHPQAHIQLWWDKDNDIIYLARCWKDREKTADEAWRSVKKWNSGYPCAWPADGNQHEKGGGKQLKYQYSAEGFMMLADHATWAEGGVSLESGVSQLRERMIDGKFKVFSECFDFFDEFRFYHRDKNGNLVKKKDDVLSAVRYAYMMRRFALPNNANKTKKSFKMPTPMRPMGKR